MNRSTMGHRMARSSVLVMWCAGLILTPAIAMAQSDPNMSNVPDVLQGQRYLSEVDDIVLLQQFQLTDSSGSTTMQTGLLNLTTSNSTVASNTFTHTYGVGLNQIPYNVNAGTAMSSIGLGRFFNKRQDMSVAIFADSFWRVSLTDYTAPSTPEKIIQTKFGAYGQVYSQVVVGDFNGNGYSDALLFYASVGSNQIEWGLNILSATDVNDTSQWAVGPQLYNFAPSGVQVPVTGSFVAGDFNGDGRDEIAALYTDNQTIQFFSVDPKTLAITPSASLKLPQPLVAGSLAAGRFRNTSNEELVAAGQLSGQANGVTVYSIAVSPNQDGTFSPAVAQTSNTAGQDVPNVSESLANATLSGTMAQAAPILNPYQGTGEQLILGLQYAFPSGDNNSDPYHTGVIWFGSFDPAFNFILQMSQDMLDERGCLINMQVGNFDNRLSSPDQNQNDHNPALQLALFENEGTGSNPHPQCTPLGKGGTLTVKIVQVNIPDNYPPESNLGNTGWLTDTAVVTPFGSANSYAIALAAGDLQGRSLRLGQPEKVVITDQLQPDLVLGMPPMHVDWIAPHTNILNPNTHPGCQDSSTPCLLNLTVQPSLPAPGVGFSTIFDFSSSSSSDLERKSTTSWGLAVKQTAEEKISYGIPDVADVSADIKNVAQYSHDNTVAKTYNTYSGKSESLNAATGFGDHVFFTQRTHNVYYYPVIGKTACPTNHPGCPNPAPMYVEFSVPDKVTHADVDGYLLEWYQPAHEPGNVLSYPWTASDLQNQFGSKLKILTEEPPSWSATDTSGLNYSTKWSKTAKQSNSSGSTNTLSDELSISVQANASVEGLGVDDTLGLDVKNSTSWSTLNVSTQALSESEGVLVNKPVFDSDVAQCCSYQFASYVFGLQPPNGTYQQISPLNPDTNTKVDVEGIGPLFVGFVADPSPNGNPGWWRQVYSLPDVGLTHAERWSWSKSRQQVSFNAADTSGQLSPLDQPFYAMKGFFVTPSGGGPAISEAKAGDALSLSARIYNFSLVDTNDPSLPHPAQAIHVRFYGQRYSSGDLSGNAFEIGETQIASIPAFRSSPGPNWTIATVPFDTTNYANTFLVFWVAVWMEDADGNLVAEMPGHGLTANLDGVTLARITDAPIEPYSNNVGMYGVHSQFFIAPATAAPDAAREAGTINHVSLSIAKRKTPVENRITLMARLKAGEQPSGHISVAFYDGDPKRGGKLFDVQRVSQIASGSIYSLRGSYTPDACGPHTIFVVAQGRSGSALADKSTLKVTADPIQPLQSLIAATMAAHLRGGEYQLVRLLKAAEKAFRHGQSRVGEDLLREYRIRLEVQAFSRHKSQRQVRDLLEQVKLILSCV